MSLVLGATATDLELDDSVGLAESSVDYSLGDKHFVNIGAWYTDINTEADVIVDGDVAATVDDIEISLWVYAFTYGLDLY